MIRGRKVLEAAMKDRMKKRRPVNYSSSSSSSSFWLAFFVLLCRCALFFTAAFPIFRVFGVSFRPVLISTWQTSAMNALSSEQPLPLEIQIQEAVSLPDLILLFIKPPSIPSSDLQCLYYHPNSSPNPNLKLPPISASIHNLFVRCPVAPHASSVSLSVTPLLSLPPVQPLNWDHLAYSAVLDHRDATTVVFAKGFNLRSARLSDPNRYKCVFGWHFGNPNYALTAPPVFSAAQEIFRCKTPLSVLSRPTVNNPPSVTVRTKGRGSITLPTVARPQTLSTPGRRKKHNMCVCTMITTVKMTSNKLSVR